MTAWTYTVWDKDGRCIYVGATRNLFTRLDQHKSTWWAPQAARVHSKVYPTYAEALAAEKLLIIEHLPRWNVAGKFETRHRWNHDDYLDYRTALIKATNGSPLTNYQRAHLANVDRIHENYLAYTAVAA